MSKRKKKNNGRQNNAQKIKDWVTRVGVLQGWIQVLQRGYAVLTPLYTYSGSVVLLNARNITWHGERVE